MSPSARALIIAVALTMVTATLPAPTNAQLPQGPDAPPEDTPAPPGVGVACIPRLTTAEVTEGLAVCTGPFPATRVTNGNDFTCVLTSDGNVHCWGKNNQGQADGYTGGDAVDIDGGNVHACAALSSGNVECWGRDIGGQTDPYTGGDAVQVATGSGHNCAVLEDGDVACWGLDIGGRADDYHGGDAIQVTAGIGHTCAVLESGDVECWGQDALGQARGYSGGDAVQVSSGYFHTCALLEDGNVECWGDDRDGQAAPFTGGNATDLAAGFFHSCVLYEDGNSGCWGNRGHTYTGGDGVQVSRYSDEGCVLTELGSVTCLGSNPHGETNDYQPILPSFPGASGLPANTLSGHWNCDQPTPGLWVCDSNGDGVPDRVDYEDEDRQLSAWANPNGLPYAMNSGVEYTEDGVASARVVQYHFPVFIVIVTGVIAEAATAEESPIGENGVRAESACIGVIVQNCVAMLHDAEAETGPANPLGENRLAAATTTCLPLAVPGVVFVGCGDLVREEVSLGGEQAGEQDLVVGLRDSGQARICANGDHVDHGCQTTPDPT